MTTVRRSRQLPGSLQHPANSRVPKGLAPAAAAIYPFIAKGRDLIVETVRPDDTSVLLPPLMRIRKANQGVQALVVRERPEDITRTAELLRRELDRRSGRKRRFSVVALDTVETSRKQDELVSQTPDVLVSSASRIIDQLRRDNLELKTVRTCVLEQPEGAAAGGFRADIEFIYSKLGYSGESPQTALFTTPGSGQGESISALLRRPAVVVIPEEEESTSHASQQERKTVSKKSFQHVRQDQALKNRIQEIVREIHDDEDPDELNAYRSVINANVSIFTRGYFAAYLMKQLYKGPSSDRGRKSRSAGSSANGRGQKNATAQKPAATEVETPTENTSSIFISVGKNRKVFPRDLIQLFSGVDSITPDDIGQIKILDNYSFVELANDKTDSAIEALNNTEFRGRKLTVNYARKKD